MTILRPDRPDQYDPETADILAHAAAYRHHGTLWRAGGLGDQPAAWWRAVQLANGTYLAEKAAMADEDARAARVAQQAAPRR